MPKKAGEKRKTKLMVTRSDYFLVDLSKYSDDGKTNYTVGQVQEFIKTSGVIKSHQECLAVRKELCVLVFGEHEKKANKYLNYANELWELKKETSKSNIRYVFINTLCFNAPSRRLYKYNYTTTIPAYEIMAHAHHIRIGKSVPKNTVHTALTFRALFRNKACTTPLKILFANSDLLGVLKYDSTDYGATIGEGVNWGIAYEMLRMRRNFASSDLKVIDVGPFLRQRGCTVRTRIGQTNDDYEFTVISGYTKRKYNYYLCEGHEKFGPKVSQLLTLKDCEGFLTGFPTSGSRFFPAFSNSWISAKYEKNIYELISSGLYFQPKKELTKLAGIPGCKPSQVFMAAFLLTFFMGYCELRDRETIQLILDEQQRNIVSALFTMEHVKDREKHKLTCCSNDEHYMLLGPWRVNQKIRMLFYANKSNDGECCYRYMMKRHLPEISIKN